MAVVEQTSRIYEGTRIPSPIPTVLQQAGVSILAQANALPQAVLKLLQ